MVWSESLISMCTERTAAIPPLIQTSSLKWTKCKIALQSYLILPAFVYAECYAKSVVRILITVMLMGSFLHY